MTSPEGRIVAAVLFLLRGRNGFDSWWDEIESDIQSEIKTALRNRIRDEIDP